MNKLNNMYKIIVIVSLYLMGQIIADVTAFKMIDLWGIIIPGGTFIYALTFTIRDMAHKQLGYKNTLMLICMAGIVNVIMALYFMLTINLKSPVWFEYSEAYSIVMGIVPRVVAASIVAEIISQMIDTHVYQKWWERFPKAPQFTRVLTSNLVSLPIDSLIFGGLAFTGTMPFVALISVIVGQIIIKAIITVVTLPVIYTVPQSEDVVLGKMG